MSTQVNYQDARKTRNKWPNPLSGRLKGTLPISGRRESSEESDPVCACDPRPLIPEGDWIAGCCATTKFYHPLFKREVLCLQFTVMDEPYLGAQLERFCQVVSRIGRNSVYLREWTIANGGIPPKRRDRMPPGKFVGKIYRIRVRTVEKTWDGRFHPTGLRYSVVAEILELVTTNENMV